MFNSLHDVGGCNSSATEVRVHSLHTRAQSKICVPQRFGVEQCQAALEDERWRPAPDASNASRPSYACAPANDAVHEIGVPTGRIVVEFPVLVVLAAVVAALDLAE